MPVTERASTVPPANTCAATRNDQREDFPGRAQADEKGAFAASARRRVLGLDPLAIAKEFPVDRTGSRRLLQLPVVGDSRNGRRSDILDANLHAQPNSTPDSWLPVPISQ